MKRLICFLVCFALAVVTHAQVITTVAGTGSAGYSGDGRAATAANISSPSGTAIDTNGNIYIVDQGNNCIRKVDKYGVITTVVGDGTYGSGGDGGQATAAQLGNPFGIAIDRFGNLFISDQSNNRIRKVTATGIISTYAGGGAGGDGGAATAASLSYPTGIATDASGNLYISDTYNNRIRKVTSTGIISTVAGNGTYGYSGDGGAATAAKISYPYGVAIDTNNNIFIAEYGGYKIRKVTSSGIISTFAGSGYGYSGDGGAATAAEVYQPMGIATDKLGNVYISQNAGYSCIRKINSFGIISTFAGTGDDGYSGDGGAADTAKLHGPIGIAVDRSGNIFVADIGNKRVRRIGCALPIVSGITGDTVINISAPLSFSDSTVGGVWTSSDTTVARVTTSGVVSGIAPGKAYIYYEVTNSCGSAYAIKSITARYPNPPSGIISNFAGGGSVLGDGGAATAAQLNIPEGIAMDSIGNIYVADRYNHRVRKISTSGVITTIAGTGTLGFTGDGSAATAARLNYPNRVAVDRQGNVFINDANNNRIRKINTSGVISTYAGNGTYGYGGDGGAATAAYIGSVSIAVDRLGNLYFATGVSNRIRKVNTSGIISTIAGLSSAGFSGDGAAATAAQFNNIVSVAVDSAANLYLYDGSNYRIRKVSITGTVTTICGNGASGSAGEGGYAINSNIGSYGFLTVGKDGTVYFSDANNGKIKKIDGSGIVFTHAGTRSFSYSGDGGPATAAGLDPRGVVTNATGDLFVADNNRIRKIGCSPPSISAIAGANSVCVGNNITVIDSFSGGVWISGNSSVASVSTSGIVRGISLGSATISYSITNSCSTSTAVKVINVVGAPTAGVISGTANIATGSTTTLTDTVSGGTWSSGSPSVATVSGSGVVTGVAPGTASISYSVSNSCGTAVAIRTISVSCAAGTVSGSSIITTIAGTGTYSYSGDGGAATAANLRSPLSVVVDGSGNIYFSGDSRVRKVTPSGTISTIAGNGTPGYSGDGGAATAARLYYPNGVAIDGSGNVYIADAGNGLIRKITTSTGIINTIAGNYGTGGYSGDGGAATAAGLAYPTGVAVDGSGNVYIADNNNHRIRKVTPSGTISTIAGNGTLGYSGDGGAATAAELYYPFGVAIDGSGNVYISDNGSARIRKVTPSGTISTIAGTGTPGYSGDGGAATAANLSYLYGGVAFDGSGNMYIADYNNHRLRRVTPSGTISTIAGTGTAGYNGDSGAATAANLRNPVGVAIDGNGNVYLAEENNNLVRKVSASSVSAGTISGSATVCVGATTTLSDSTSGGTWSSSSTSVATVNSSGVVTGVSAGSVTISYNVSNSCGSAFAIKSLTVNASPSAPAAISGATSVCVGATTTLTDSTSGGTWSSSSSSNASVSSTGIITGVAVGSVSISYSVTNSCGTARATTSLTINPAPSAGTISGASTVNVSSSTALTPSVSGGSWSSSASGVATVSGSGVVIGLAPGAATISYSVSNSCGTAVAISAITVSCAAASVSGSSIITTFAGGGAGDGLPATAATLNSPSGVAVDGSGNVYIADANNNRIRKVSTSGTITTIAGNGTAGFSGDGGAATDANLSYPSGVAVDGSGNVYIVDLGNNRIRKVSTSGTITTFAGGGTSGLGDGGAATAANLYIPSGVAIDGSGNVYIADNGNHRIRKVSTSGTITTVAGNGIAGFNGDGGAATAARLNSPSGVTVDGIGNVYIADQYSYCIRKVSTSGTISTIAGDGTYGYSGDGGAATDANLSGPLGVAIDGSGNVYIADANNHLIRKVSTSGTITTIAGDGTSGFSGDGGAATAAILDYPSGVAVDGSGNVYIADANNNRIRKVSTSGTITTIAGNGTAGFSGDGGVATAATLNDSYGVAVDGSGNLYIADYSNSRIRKVSTSGTITTIAGNGTAGFSGDGGAATDANLSGPYGVAVDASGNVYIGDFTNNRIRKVSTSGTITTIAGNGTAGFSGDGGAATDANLSGPSGVAVDGSGNVYIADHDNHRIRKVSASGTITTFAGDGTAGFSGDGGAATAATVDGPVGVAVDGSGNVYIADANNNRIRKVSTSGTITTIAGNGTYGYSGDGGAATAATLYNPFGVAIDGSGNVYIADDGNHRIRKVSTSGTISTIAGDGTYGYSGDGDAATAAKLSSLTGVAVDGSWNVYIAVAGSNRIRKVSASSVSAGTISGSVTVCAGATTNLSDSTSGGTWSSGSTSVATVNSSGVVTGVSIGSADITYTVTNSCGSAFAIKTLTVNASPSSLAAISGASSVCVGATTMLTDSTSGGVWSSSNNAIASVNSSGVVTGVSEGSATINYSVTNSCGTARATTSLTINPAPNAGTLSGASAVNVSASTTLTPSVSGGSWSSSASGVATVSGSGVVTGVAPGTATISYSVSNSCGTAVAISSITVSCAAGTVSGSSIITTFAGTGTAGYSGDGGAATAAKLDHPLAVAVDGSGNAYILDRYNHCIRKVTVSGTISTIAGNGTAGYGGDGGAATAAELNYPVAVAVDGSGNVYVADYNNHRIRKVTSSGTISTIAGNGTAGYSGDGGAATAAELRYPAGVAVDGSGNVYIGDYPNQRIRKVTASGIISTIAGTGTAGYSGDGGAATAAQLKDPIGVAVDGSGNVYIADCNNQRIRKVTSSGTISTFAGNGTWGYSGDGGAATAAELHNPMNVAVDGSGNVYIADYSNYCTRKVTPSGTISTIAGNGAGGYSGDGGAATSAQLNDPWGVAVDASGNVYIGDQANHRIRKVGNYALSSVAAIIGSSSVCSGSSVSLFDATSGGSWNSSDTLRATVDSSGVVTGVSAGSVTISYTVSNSCGSSFVAYSLTVIASPSSPAAISGASSVCVGATTTLTDSTSSGVWSSSDTAIASVDSVGLVLGRAAGVVTISYSVANSCGTAVATKAITGNTSPSVAAITGASSMCIDATITLADSITGGTWSSSGASVAMVSTTGIVSGVSAGTTTISYTISNTCGATSVTKAVTVNSNPSVTATATALPICRGSNTVLSASGATTYTWVPGTGLSATTGASVTATPTVTTTYTVTGTTSGCSGTAPALINVIATPTVAAITGASSLCSGSTITLADSTAGGTWSSSDTAIASVGSTGVVLGRAAGSVAISYSVSNSCGTAVATKAITVNTSPTLAVTPIASAICSGSTTNMTASGATAYTWSPSAGLSASTGASVTFNHTVTTTYTVTGTTNGCVGTAAQTITVTPIPTITVTPVASTVCRGNTTNMTASGATTYTWSPSTGLSASTGATVTFSGSATATYTVTGTTGTCSATALQTITVNPIPTVTVSAVASTICSGNTTNMTASGATNYTWSPSTGLSASTGATVMFSGTATATYTVTGTTTGCSATATQTITIAALPTAGTLSGNDSVCQAATTRLSSTVTGGVWSSSSAGIATIDSTGWVTGVSVGRATITYTVTTVCGTATATKSINVNPLPVQPSAITGVTSICSGNSLTLSASTAGGNWSSSALGVATVNSSGVVSTLSGGTTTISYTITNSCGSRSATASLVVTPTPTNVTLGLSSLCQGDTLRLTNAISGGTWLSGSPSVAPVDASGTLVALSAGSTNVIYFIINACGYGFHTYPVSISSPVVPAIAGASAVCAGSSTTLTNVVTGGTWSSSNTAVATVSNAGVVTGIGRGSATISYGVVNACGTRYSTLTMSVDDNAVSGINGVRNLCMPDSIQLTDSTPGGTWSAYDTAIVRISSSGRVRGVAVGSAVVVYSISNSCGITNRFATIGVGAAPVAGSVSGPATLVVSGNGSYSASVSGGVWSVTNSAIATINNVGVLTANAVGTDTVVYTVSNSCGAVAALQRVVITTPSGIISGPTAVCAGTTITLSSTASGGSWSSSNNTVASVVAATGVVRGNAAGNATITYTVGSYRSTYSITVQSATVTGITGSSSVCLGSNTAFSNSSAGGTWSNTFPSITSVSNTGMVYGLAAGVDTIRYTYTTVCGTFSTIKTITVTGYPSVLAIGGTTGAICVGATRTNTAGTGGGVWSLSDTTLARITSAPGTSVTTLGLIAGNDTLKYTVTNSCGLSTTVTSPLRINANPYVSAISGTNMLCARTSATFTDSVAGGVWSSSNSAIASVVAATGVVTGVTAGTATITYTITSLCGTSYATFPVTVISVPDAGVISGSSIVCLGSSSAFVSSATGGTWSNNPVTLATVSTDGIVTGIALGTDTLLYTITNSCGTSVASKVVTISPMPFAGVITGDSTLAAGFTTTYASSVTGGVWSSSNTTLATINTTGTASGLAPGLDTIRYSYTNSCGTDVAVKLVTVTLDAGTISGPTGVCVGGSTITLSSTVPGGSWVSSNSAIASINATTGQVTGLLVGTVTITYSYGFARSYYTVAAQTSGVAAILGGSSSLCQGATMTLTDATAGGVWTSAQPTRSTISAMGVVTGVGAGADTIRYTVTNSCGTFEARKYITVIGVSMPLAISGSSAAICQGATRTNANGTTGGTWSLSGTGIATIAPSGTSVVVTGLAGGVDTLKYSITNSCGLVGTVRSVVTVTPTPNAGTISGLSTVAIGSTVTLTNSGANGVGTWSHSAPAIASITASGTTLTVRGRVAGVDTIRYTFTNTCGTNVARYAVTVLAGKGVAEPTAITNAVTVNVYPNPSNGMITVKANENITQVMVTDLTGKLITEVTGNDAQMEVDLSAYASGIYLLRIATVSGVQMVKVVKE